jgi:hypothetical protein
MSAPGEEVERAELLDVAAQVGEPADELRIERSRRCAVWLIVRWWRTRKLGHLALPRG